MSLDRLSPFTRLIRNLSRSRTERADDAALKPQGNGAQADPQSVETAPQDTEDLRERLRSRMAPLVHATPERRCRAFVETVLLSELSETAGTDPHFAEIVGRVARELASDTRVSARLDELLVHLPKAPR